MTLRHRILPMLFALLCVTTLSAQAQLTAVIDSVDVSAYPKITLRVIARQGPLIRKDFTAQETTVKEDGFNQTPLTIIGTQGSTPFGVAMVAGNGSTMSAGDVNIAQGAARILVDSLDGLNDEAALQLYATTVSTILGPQVSKQILINSISAIVPGTGANHMWDGAHAGINAIVFESTPARAVFLMSNGIDDGSSKNFSDVVRLSKSTKIPIYVLGLSASGGASNLQNIVDSTGGMYFTNPELAVQTMVHNLRGTPDYFFVEYTSNYQCKDGVSRAIELKFKSGSDSVKVNGSYTAPLDASSNKTVVIEVDTLSVASGKTATLGVKLKTVVSNQHFNPAILDLAFDKMKLGLVRVETDSAMLPDNLVTYTETLTGARIDITKVSQLPASAGRLLKLFFTGGDVTQNTVVPVAISSLLFSKGCLTPQLVAGRISVLPKNFGLTGSSKPYTFVWNESKKDYDPSIEIVKADVTNTGDLPVTGLTATLPATGDYKFVNGSTATARVVPDSLAPGQKGTAQWSIKAIPRPDEKGQQIDVAINAKQAVTGTAKIFLNIKPATSAVSTTCSVTPVTVSAGKHSPDPAVVTAVVKCAGSAASPAGQVAITLPGALSLAGGSAAQNFASLAPAATQPLTWNVTYPKNLATTTSYDIVLVTSGSGFPSDTNIVRLTIPVATGPSVTSTCISHPAAMAYDGGTKTWPAIQVKARVRNTGSGASDSLFAELAVPPALRLASGETARKFLPGAMPAGDSADVTWNVEAAGSTCVDLSGQFGYTLRVRDSVLFSCTSAVKQLKRPNTAPALSGKTPATLDTIAPGTNQNFTVSATDADGDAISYQWTLNGAAVGANQNSYANTFGSIGAQTLRCVMKDACGDSAVATWTFRVDNKTAAEGTPLASGFAIARNYPNPFSSETAIEFTVPEGERDVQLDVTDASGRVVALLVRGRLAGGTHTAVLKAGALGSGVYMARLRSGNATVTRALILSK